MTRVRTLVTSSLLTLLVSHCGGRVASDDAQVDVAADQGLDITPSSDVSSSLDATTPIDASPTASCADVRASCGAAPHMVVRGHATGLTGVDGSLAQFGVRYLTTTGMGLAVPHALAMGRAEISGGAFEICVCVPEGANNYPIIAAVVFAPGSTSQSSRDVTRALVSQRYATLGDEDLSSSLQTLPGAIETEVALAQVTDRTADVTVRSIDATHEGAHVYAGLIANARPVAAELTTATVASGTLALQWSAPGAAWPDETLIVLIDHNANALCDNGDEGMMIPLNGRQDVPAAAMWLQGSALMPVCDGLRVDVMRAF